jgi:hypothetical protein
MKQVEENGCCSVALPGGVELVLGPPHDTIPAPPPTVPAPPPEPAVADRIDEVMKEVGDMLKAKNAAYGNSALEPIRIFSTAPADEQLRVRIDDKLSRLARGAAAGEDVVLDLIGYLVLLRIAQRS